MSRRVSAHCQENDEAYCGQRVLTPVLMRPRVRLSSKCIGVRYRELDGKPVRKFCKISLILGILSERASARALPVLTGMPQLAQELSKSRARAQSTHPIFDLGPSDERGATSHTVHLTA